MADKTFLERRGIVRNAIKKDMLQFMLPGTLVFFFELVFCACTEHTELWVAMWNVIKQPKVLFSMPFHNSAGLLLIAIGIAIAIVGPATLWRSYSATVLIRKDHQLITHGIYRFTRNPIYLGVLLVTTALPLYTASLSGFLVSLPLFPIVGNRIRLEESLLSEEFGDRYQAYKKTSKRLFPLIY